MVVVCDLLQTACEMWCPPPASFDWVSFDPGGGRMTRGLTPGISEKGPALVLVPEMRSRHWLSLVHLVSTAPLDACGSNLVTPTWVHMLAPTSPTKTSIPFSPSFSTSIFHSHQNSRTFYMPMHTIPGQKLRTWKNKHLKSSLTSDLPHLGGIRRQTDTLPWERMLVIPYLSC